MEAKTIPDVAKLGEGEQEVLALALQSREAVVIMDERLGRSYAESLDLRATGTLGILSAQRGKAESSITTLARTTTANYSDSVSIVSARTRETLLKRAAEIA